MQCTTLGLETTMGTPDLVREAGTKPWSLAGNAGRLAPGSEKVGLCTGILF